jgi:hypothetical protein
MSDWNLGLDPTPVTGTDPVEAMNRINFHNHSGVGKGEPISAENIVTAPAGDLTSVNQAGVNAELNVLANLGRIHVPVRQTVLSGHIDPATNLPAFLVTDSGLSINILASSTPLIIAFAYNLNKLFGQIDFVKSIDQDIPSAWSALPPNQTCYLYVDRNIDTGVLTYGYSLFAPVYQNLAPETPSTDQHWFDLNTYYMKRYSGTAWENKQRVFVGECTTGASSVTSVICYALQGRYDSGWFAVAANQGYTKNHNIGIRIPNGLQLQFYYSMDANGNDASFAHDIYYASDQFAGHLINATPQQTRNVIKIYFSHNVQYYGTLRTSGYYRILIKRSW